MFKINRKLLIMALFSMLSIGMIGCGTKTTTTTESKPANSTSTSDNKAVNTTASKPDDSKKETASADKIGVAECDEYIEKYEACVFDKVPEAQRAMFKSSLETMRKSWKEAAATPQGKSALATGCKTALESAKTSMASFSCKW